MTFAELHGRLITIFFYIEVYMNTFSDAYYHKKRYEIKKWYFFHGNIITMSIMLLDYIGFWNTHFITIHDHSFFISQEDFFSHLTIYGNVFLSCI